jgi:hypothetical protein
VAHLIFKTQLPSLYLPPGELAKEKQLRQCSLRFNTTVTNNFFMRSCILLSTPVCQLVTSFKINGAEFGRNLVPKELPLANGDKRNGRPRERPVGITSFDHLNHIEIREQYEHSSGSVRKGIRYESNGFCRSVSPCASFEKFSLCEKSYSCFWATGCDIGACGMAACLPGDKRHCRDIYDQQLCSSFPDCMWIIEQLENANDVKSGTNVGTRRAILIPLIGVVSFFTLF